MTPETLAELRRLAEAATPGPLAWTPHALIAAVMNALPALLDAAAERDALAAKVARVRALASGMGTPRSGADTDRDSVLMRMTLRTAGHRILRALDEEPQP